MAATQKTKYIYPPVFLIANSGNRMVYYDYAKDQFYLERNSSADKTNTGWMFIALPLTIAIINAANAVLVRQGTLRNVFTGLLTLVILVSTPFIVRRYLTGKKHITEQFLQRLVPTDYLVNEQEKQCVRKLFQTQSIILWISGVIVALSAVLFLLAQNTVFGFVYGLGCPLFYLMTVTICPLKKRQFMKRYEI